MYLLISHFWELIVSSLTVWTIYKRKAVLWVLNGPLIMWTFLWVALKNVSSTFCFKDFKFYLRYINEIFLIWNGTKGKFEVILKKIDNSHSLIEFEYQISKTEINFLGATVSRVSNQLHNKIYTKPLFYEE